MTGNKQRNLPIVILNEKMIDIERVFIFKKEILMLMSMGLTNEVSIIRPPLYQLN